MRPIDDYGPAPLDVPEAYPGLWPSGAVLVAGVDVTPVPLPTDTTGRTAMLAVGSSASPAQLHRRRVEGAVLLTPTLLHNHLVVYADHLTRYGAIPATVVRWPGARCEVFLSWLTPQQHDAMEDSEDGHYDGVLLPTADGMVPGYRARSGAFRHRGQVVRLASVRTKGSALPPTMDQSQVLRAHAARR